MGHEPCGVCAGVQHPWAASGRCSSTNMRVRLRVCVFVGICILRMYVRACVRACAYLGAERGHRHRNPHRVVRIIPPACCRRRGIGGFARGLHGRTAALPSGPERRSSGSCRVRSAAGSLESPPREARARRPAQRAAAPPGRRLRRAILLAEAVVQQQRLVVLIAVVVVHLVRARIRSDQSEGSGLGFRASRQP